MSFVVDRLLSDNYANYYDQEDLAEWRRLGAVDKCSNILRLCGNIAHRNILEIGCGDGAILERLSTLGFGSSFTGLEISASAAERVQKRNVANLNVQLFGGYEVSFPEQYFDLAIMSHVIEHVEYPRKLIREAARVAKVVFVEVPLEDNWRLSNDFVFDRVGHINFYNPKTIRHLVQSCGMTIMDACVSDGSPASHVYRKGPLKGTVSYLAKKGILKVWPRVATACFTYHYALICKTS